MEINEKNKTYTKIKLVTLDAHNKIRDEKKWNWCCSKDTKKYEIR